MVDDPLEALGGRQREADAMNRDDADISAELRDLLRPFEGQERDGLLDGVFARLDAASEAPPSANDERAPVDGVGSVAQAPVDLGAQRSRRSVLIGVVVAMAAAVLLWVGLRPSPTTLGGDGLPSYQATQLRGGASQMRAAEAGVPTRLELEAADRIEWTFTPGTPARQPVAAVLLAVPTEGEPVLTPLSEAEVSERGVVRLVGSLEDFVRLSPGPWHVTVIIGAPDALPSTTTSATADGPWARVELDLVVAEPGSP
ncbi:MAG: hypothetical protein AB1Z98_40640 [Nannocystaceae bacterium]